LKRLKWTFVLFGFAIAITSAVYFVVSKVQQDTDRRVNAIVCVTRPYIEQSRARSQQTANDTHQTDAERARAQQAVTASDQFLAGLLLHPRGYDCKPLLEKLLRDAQERENRIEREARSGKP